MAPQGFPHTEAVVHDQASRDVREALLYANGAKMTALGQKPEKPSLNVSEAP